MLGRKCGRFGRIAWRRGAGEKPMFWEAICAADQYVSRGRLADCHYIAVIFKQEKGIYKDMCISAHVFQPRLKPAWQDRQGDPETLCVAR